jgi:hypothetical protein
MAVSPAGALLAALVVGLAACDASDPACVDCVADDEAGDDDDDPPDVFADDLIDIALELPEADWDVLRHQYKSRHTHLLGADCLASPAPNPYAWFEADATIDGVRHARVGLRKKGLFGSQSTLKPSLKLDLDRYVDGQDHGGLTRLALNNSRGDPSYGRTCLTYGVFAAAGLPAPRCTFARVSLNGEPLGVYVAVEEVGKRFLRHHLGDDDAGGNLYEGTVSDFRRGYLGSFEQETNAAADPDRDELAAVTEVLETASDAELVAALEPLVDLDAFYRFWAAETLTWHRDGYTGNVNNFFVYADPARGGRLIFIPWGPDGALKPEARTDVPYAVMAFGRLPNRLYAVPEARARFEAELAALLATVWDEDALVAEAERISAIVSPDMRAVEAPGHAAALALLIEMIEGRRDQIAAATVGGAPPWTAGLRGAVCKVPVGQLEASFTTTWGTLASNLFTAGTGGFDATIDDVPIVVEQVGGAPRIGARAGATSTGRGRLQLIAYTAGLERYYVTAEFPDERWHAPLTTVGEHPLTMPPFGMTMKRQDRTTSPATDLRSFEIGEGTWTFDQIGTAAGDPVVGSFSAMAYVTVASD